MADTPKRRGRPPSVMASPTDRLSQLSAREKALAIKSKAKHRYVFDMPLEMYEGLLDEAEAWSTPLPDVVRACIRAGLEHIKQFGARDHNPYIYGQLKPPTQAQFDPTGTAWPPTHPGQVHQAPSFFDGPPPLPLREDLPPAMVFRTPTVRPGMLPNGYTDNLQTTDGNRHYDEHPPYNNPEVFGDDSDTFGS